MKINKLIKIKILDTGICIKCGFEGCKKYFHIECGRKRNYYM